MTRLPAALVAGWVSGRDGRGRRSSSECEDSKTLGVSRWHTAAVPDPLPPDPATDAPLTAEELATVQGVGSVGSVDDVRADIWKDDAEVDAFIEDVRRARRANIS